MLDYKNPKSVGKCAIAKIALKRSGEDGVDVPVLEIELDEEVASASDAEAIDGLVPGALRYYGAHARARAAGDSESVQAGAAAGSAAASESGGPFGTSTIPIREAGIRLVVSDVDGRAQTFTGSEIRSLRLKTTPKLCLYAVMVRIPRPDRKAIDAVIDWYGAGAVLSVTAESAQGVLPYKSREIGQIGQILSGLSNGNQWCGVLRGRSKGDNGEDLVEIDDFGELRIYPAVSVVGAPTNVGSADELAAAIDVYSSLCAEREIDPSWTDLFPELGAVYLSEPPSDGIWRVTDSIAETAADTAANAAAANEPAEA